MNDGKGPQADTPNLMEMADNFARIAAQSQQIVKGFVARQQSAGNISEKDPLNVGEANTGGPGKIGPGSDGPLAGSHKALATHSRTHDGNRAARSNH